MSGIKPDLEPDDPLAGYTPDWRKSLGSGARHPRPEPTTVATEPPDPLEGYTPDWRARSLAQQPDVTAAKVQPRRREFGGLLGLSRETEPGRDADIAYDYETHRSEGPKPLPGETGELAAVTRMPERKVTKPGEVSERIRKQEMGDVSAGVRAGILTTAQLTAKASKAFGATDKGERIAKAFEDAAAAYNAPGRGYGFQVGQGLGSTVPILAAGAVGGGPALAASSYLIGVGDLKNTIDQMGDYADDAIAIGLGFPYAKLESIFPADVLARMGGSRVVGLALAKGLRGQLGRVGVETARGIIEEGVPEALQSFLTNYGAALASGLPPDHLAFLKQAGQEGLAGAVTGGVIAGGTQTSFEAGGAAVEGARRYAERRDAERLADQAGAVSPEEQGLGVPLEGVVPGGQQPAPPGPPAEPLGVTQPEHVQRAGIAQLAIQEQTGQTVDPIDIAPPPPPPPMGPAAIVDQLEPEHQTSRGTSDYTGPPRRPPPATGLSPAELTSRIPPGEDPSRGTGAGPTDQEFMRYKVSRGEWPMPKYEEYPGMHGQATLIAPIWQWDWEPGQVPPLAPIAEDSPYAGADPAQVFGVLSSAGKYDELADVFGHDVAEIARRQSMRAATQLEEPPAPAVEQGDAYEPEEEGPAVAVATEEEPPPDVVGPEGEEWWEREYPPGTVPPLPKQVGEQSEHAGRPPKQVYRDLLDAIEKATRFEKGALEHGTEKDFRAAEQEVATRKAEIQSALGFGVAQIAARQARWNVYGQPMTHPPEWLQAYEAKYAIGKTVTHAEHGEGKIIGYTDDDRLKVQFGKRRLAVGPKTLTVKRSEGAAVEVKPSVAPPKKGGKRKSIAKMSVDELHQYLDEKVEWLRHTNVQPTQAARQTAHGTWVSGGGIGGAIIAQARAKIEEIEAELRKRGVSREDTQSALDRFEAEREVAERAEEERREEEGKGGPDLPYETARGPYEDKAPLAKPGAARETPPHGQARRLDRGEGGGPIRAGELSPAQAGPLARRLEEQHDLTPDEAKLAAEAITETASVLNGQAGHVKSKKNLAFLRRIPGIQQLAYSRKAIADFVKTARATVMKGQRIKDVKDLAAAFYIFRHPHYETLRYIFLKKGKIVHVEAISSRIPGATSAVPPGYDYDQAARDVKIAMMAFGADEFYLQHNHPTGSPQPSPEDHYASNEMFKAMEKIGIGDKLKGHLIIDHDTFGFMRPNSTEKWQEQILPQRGKEGTPDPLLESEAELPGPMIGKKLKGVAALATLVTETRLDISNPMIVWIGSDGRVVAVQQPPKPLDMHDIDLVEWARRIGARGAVVVTSDPKAYVEIGSQAFTTATQGKVGPLELSLYDVLYVDAPNRGLEAMSLQLGKAGPAMPMVGTTTIRSVKEKDLFGEEEPPKVEKGQGQLFGEEAKPTAPVQGMSAAVAKAQKLVADPKEAFQAKHGKPSKEYTEAKALLAREEKIGGEEIEGRGEDIRGVKEEEKGPYAELPKAKIGAPGGPGFFSRLEASIQRTKLDKAPWQTWVSKLRGNMSSAEEFDWAFGHVRAGPEVRLTKQEMLAIARNKGYGAIGEIRHEEPKPTDPTPTPEEATAINRFNLARNQIQRYLGPDDTTSVISRFRRWGERAIDPEQETEWDEASARHRLAQIMQVDYEPDLVKPEIVELAKEIFEAGPIYAKYNERVKPTFQSDLRRHKAYVEPGGTDYREVLFVLPAHQLDEPFRVTGHWHEDNVLMHVRLNDRVGPNGEKVLHVEEVQSDLHQRGRDYGYKGDPLEITEDMIKEEYGLSDKDWADMSERDQGHYRRDAERDIPERRAPNAPFKNTSDWLGLGVRRILDEAKAGGYDMVSWTPGKLQADRYNLRKVADEITYHPTKHELVALRKGNVVHSSTQRPGKLHEYIGKEVMQRLLSQPLEPRRKDEPLTTEEKDYAANWFYGARPGDYISALDTQYPMMKIERINREMGTVTLVERYGENKEVLKGAYPDVWKSVNRYGSQPAVHRIAGEELEVGGAGLKVFYDKLFPEQVEAHGKKLGVKLGISREIGPEIRSKELNLDAYNRIRNTAGNDDVARALDYVVTSAHEDERDGEHVRAPEVYLDSFADSYQLSTPAKRKAEEYLKQMYSPKSGEAEHFPAFRLTKETKDKLDTPFIMGERAGGPYDAANPMSPTQQHDPNSLVNAPNVFARLYRRALGKSAPLMAESDVKALITISRELARAVGVPLRQDILGVRSAAGWFQSGTLMTRVRRYDMLSTVAHEIGHYFSYQHLGKPTAKRPGAPGVVRVRIPKSAAKELYKMGKDLYGHIAPASGYGEEGIAQWLRFYITEPGREATEAPTFSPIMNFFLDQNPYFRKAVDTAKNDYQRYKTASWRQRSEAQISIGEKDRQPFSLRAMVHNWLDRTNEFREALLLIGKDPSSLPYQLARLVAGSPGAAYQLIEDEVIPVLRQISGDDLMDFRLYLRAESAQERRANGIDPGGNRDDDQKAIDELRKKFEPLAQKLWDLSLRLVDMRVDAGMLTPGEAKIIKDKNQRRVGFYRIFDDEETAASHGFGRQWAKNSSGMKSQTGSSRVQIDPLESIVRDVYSTFAQTWKHKAATVLIKQAIRSEGGARVVYEIPTPKEPVRLTVGQVYQQLLDLGFKFKPFEELTKEEREEQLDEAMQAILLGFQRRSQPGAKDAKELRMPIVMDGKRRWFEFQDARLFEEIQGLDPTMVDGFTKWLNQQAPWLQHPAGLAAKAARGLRAGATLTTEFIARNPIRDAFTAAVYTQTGAVIPGHLFIEGIFAMAKRKQLMKEWREDGGDNATMLGLDRQVTQQQIDYWMQSAHSRTWHFVAHPIDGLRALSQLAENATRLGEYSRARRQGKSRTESAFFSREITQDFAMMGAQARAVNQLVSFFAANVGGSKKLYAELKTRPQVIIPRLVAQIMLPSLALAAIHHDDDEYKKMPRWLKDTFWILYIQRDAQGKVVKTWVLPKPPGIGQLFGSVPERIMEWIWDKDPQSLKDALESMRRAVMPPWVPNAIVPLIENYAGKSLFRDRPLVGAGTERLPEAERVTPRTGETARLLGRVPPGGYSPAKIENLVRGWTGGLGMVGLSVSDAAIRAARAASGQPPLRKVTPEQDPLSTRFPALKAFSRRPTEMDAESIHRFYQAWEDAEAQRLNWKDKLKSNPRAAAELMKKHGAEIRSAFASTDRTDKVQGALRAAKNEMDDVMAQYREAKTEDRRRSLADQADRIARRWIRHEVRAAQ